MWIKRIAATLIAFACCACAASRDSVDRTITCWVGTMGISFYGDTSLYLDTYAVKPYQFGTVMKTIHTPTENGSVDREIFFTLETGYGYHSLYRISFNDEVLTEGWMQGIWESVGIFDSDYYIAEKKPLSALAQCRYVTGTDESNLARVIGQKSVVRSTHVLLPPSVGTGKPKSRP